MKGYIVSLHLPDVVAHKAHQGAVVDATNIGQAAKRAFDEVRKRDGIKGKRIKQARITVVQIEKK